MNREQVREAIYNAVPGAWCGDELHPTYGGRVKSLTDAIMALEGPKVTRKELIRAINEGAVFAYLTAAGVNVEDE